MKSGSLFTIIIFCLIGAALRIAGIFNDLWLDEIWTLWNVAKLEAPGEILSEFLYDNNHILNSLYVYLIGPTDNGYIYRLFALVWGVASLPLFASLSLRRGEFQGKLATFMFSLSYPFVLYSSEARGYGALIFFSLLSHYLFEVFTERRRTTVLAALWLSFILGLLSQLTFLIYFISLLVWAPMRLRSDKGFFSGVPAALMIFIPPAIFLIFLYLAHIRYLPEGSGPLHSQLEVVINSLSVFAGGPELSALRPDKGAAILLGVLALFCVLCAEIFLRYRERDDSWIFLFYAVFVCPVVFLLVWQPHVVFPRYFLVSALFAYPMLASFFDRVWRKNYFGKILCSAFLLSFCLLNGTRLGDLMRYGRGDYQGALNFISQNSARGDIHVRGSMDFRDRLIIDYYSPRTMPVKKIIYHSSESSDPADDVEWLLVQTQDRDEKPQELFNLRDSVPYKLVNVFPHAGLSGWTWFVYQR